MSKVSENALWRIEKDKIMNEYLQNVQAVEKKVSGQGFLYRPGFLGEKITQIELGAKVELSAANFEIVSQMVERELAQTGHDYDIAYKNAAIAWELEKTGLLTDLEQEFADNKYDRVNDFEVLERRKITIDLRKLVIMAAKTAIEEQMEAYRQEKLLAEEFTFPYEEALLQAKLLTARKKLEVIPYIEAVIAKQQLIIDTEENNSDLKGVLITEKQGLNVVKQALIARREAIADVVTTLIAAKEALIPKKSAVVDAEALVVAQESVNAGYLSQYVQSLTGLTDVQLDLAAAKKALIPKINEKSAAIIAYAAELDAWVLVKQAIAAVKEQIASEQETRAGIKQTIGYAKMTVDLFETYLEEAKINLEIARMTGQSNILDQQSSNLPEYLTERETSLKAQFDRESELFDEQADFDQYREEQELASMEEINDYVIPKEISTIRRIAIARINEMGKTAEISANRQLTSSLVHLLGS